MKMNAFLFIQLYFTQSVVEIIYMLKEKSSHQEAAKDLKGQRRTVNV